MAVDDSRNHSSPAEVEFVGVSEALSQVELISDRRDSVADNCESGCRLYVMR
ncbi:hypothetical protein [Microbacterium sp. LWH3-1.2]|uniref:hypothetical protein n=1 Tax=Microbacterium sp. LWH3-1.2 TaxID=3135256 RepID=UPI003424CEAC